MSSNKDIFKSDATVEAASKLGQLIGILNEMTRTQDPLLSKQALRVAHPDKFNRVLERAKAFHPPLKAEEDVALSTCANTMKGLVENLTNLKNT